MRDRSWSGAGIGGYVVTIIGTLLAGLGLFFAGLQILTEHLKRLSGRRLRILVERHTRNPLFGALCGGAFAVVTQSGPATMFIIVSMLRSGLMSIRQAMPMIIGLNMFGALIVLVLVIDIRLAVLFLLGFAGVLYSGEARTVRGSLIGVVLGIAMLFFGLDLMNQSVSPLADEVWFTDLLAWTNGSFMFGFLIGCLLSFVVQSSIAVTAVVLAFYHAGMFGAAESLMLIYGANAGSSLLTLVLSIHLKGQSKQIAMYQTFYNLAGAAVLVPLLYLEVWTGVPLMLALLEMLSDDADTRLAIAFVLFNVVPAVGLMPTVGPSVRLLQRIWPDTEVEVASRPKYLHERAVDDPDTAMDLVALEQARLVGYLSRMFDALRDDRPQGAFEQIREAHGILGTTVRETIEDLGSGHRLSEQSYDRLNALLSFQHSLDAAAETMSGMAREQRLLAKSDAGRRFTGAIVEGIDTIVLTLGDVLREHDQQDRDLLTTITSDDGNGMKSVRTAYLAEERGLEADERLRLLALSNHAERLIWLLGHMGKSEAAISAR